MTMHYILSSGNSEFLFFYFSFKMRFLFFLLYTMLIFILAISGFEKLIAIRCSVDIALNNL